MRAGDWGALFGVALVAVLAVAPSLLDTTRSPMLTSSAFWKATAERAVRTFAQALLAALTANEVGLIDADWLGAASSAAMAAVLAILFAVASSGSGGPGLTETPSDDVVAYTGRHGEPVAGPAAPIPDGTAVTVLTTPEGA